MALAARERTRSFAVLLHPRKGLRAQHRSRISRAGIGRLRSRAGILLGNLKEEVPLRLWWSWIGKHERDTEHRAISCQRGDLLSTSNTPYTHWQHKLYERRPPQATSDHFQPHIDRDTPTTGIAILTGPLAAHEAPSTAPRAPTPRPRQSWAPPSPAPSPKSSAAKKCACSCWVSMQQERPVRNTKIKPQARIN